jgi:hypothetical protein
LYLECAMWSFLRRMVWQLFNVPSPSMRPTKVTSKANNTQGVANSCSLWHEFVSRRSSPHKFVDVLSLEKLLIETTRGSASTNSIHVYLHTTKTKQSMCVRDIGAYH